MASLLQPIRRPVRGKETGDEDLALRDTPMDILAAEHLEREIHGVFALAEDLIPQDKLARMANWDVDHLHEAAGMPRPWADAVGG